MEDRIRQIARESIKTKQSFFESSAGDVARAAEMIARRLADGGKLMIFGNGGSAADAQHIAAELVNRLGREHPPIAAVALSTATSILTPAANDSSFDYSFDRQLRALGRPGDVPLAISPTANSPHV